MDVEKKARGPKPAISFDEQLKKIEDRGCIIGDTEWAKSILERINYYRLTAYFLPYKEPNEMYIEGTTFNNMYRTYEFDRKLRHLLLGVIEEIEIMFRTQLSYYHAHTYGPLGYMDEKNYNRRHNHNSFIEKINEDIRHNNNSLIVQHHKQYYGGNFPIWVIIEFFSLGQLSFFYSDMKVPDKKKLAKQLFGITYFTLESWMKCITELRNICAHYSRLYNMILLSKPRTPKGLSRELRNYIFDYILILKFLYVDNNKWTTEVVENLKALIDEYKDSIQLNLIGFPEEWEYILENSYYYKISKETEE